MRWKIEPFHKILKFGAGAEEAKLAELNAQGLVKRVTAILELIADRSSDL